MAEKKNPLFGLAPGAGPNDQPPDDSYVTQFLNGLLGPGWQENPLADYALNQVIPTIQSEWEAGKQLRSLGSAVNSAPGPLGSLLGPMLYGVGGMQQMGAPAEPVVQQGTNILNTLAAPTLSGGMGRPLIPGTQPVDFTSNLQNLTNLAPGTEKPTSGNPAMDALLYMGSAVNVPDLTDLAVKGPLLAAKAAPAAGKMLAPSLAALGLTAATPISLRRWLDEKFSSKAIDISNQPFGHPDDISAMALKTSMFHDIDEFVTSMQDALRSSGLEGRGKYKVATQPSLGYSPGQFYTDLSQPLEFDEPVAHVQLFQRPTEPDRIDSIQVAVRVVQKDPNTGKYKNKGNISRTFFLPGPSRGPEATVTHGYFAIEGELQGQGLAKKVLRGAMDYYTRKGISKIEVNAGMDNGGYTWLRFGFRPQGDTLGVSRFKIKDRLNQYISGPDLLRGKKRPRLHPEITDPKDPKYNLRVPLNEDEIRLVVRTLESDDPRALWVLADSDVGWDMLNGLSWSGEVDLTSPEQMDRWLSYVGDSIDMDGVTDAALQNLKHLTDADSLFKLHWTSRPGSIPPAQMVARQPTEYTLADLPHVEDPESTAIEVLGQWAEDPYFLSKIKRGEKVRVYKYLHDDEIANTGPTILPGDLVFLDPEDARNSALANRRNSIFPSMPANAAEYEGMVMRSTLIDPRSLSVYTGNEAYTGGMLSGQSPSFHFWPGSKQEGWEVVSRQLGPWHKSRNERKFAFATRADTEIPVEDTTPGSILYRAADESSGARKHSLFLQDAQIYRKPSGQPFNLSLPDDLATWSELLHDGKLRDYYSSLGWGAVEAVDEGKRTYMVLDEDLVGSGNMRTQHYLAKAQARAAQTAGASSGAPGTGGFGAPAAQGAQLHGTLGPGVPAGQAPAPGGNVQWRRGPNDHSMKTYPNSSVIRPSSIPVAAAHRPRTVNDVAFRTASLTESEALSLLQSETPYGITQATSAQGQVLRSSNAQFINHPRTSGQSATGPPHHEAPPANSRLLRELWDDPDFVEVVPLVYNHASWDPRGHNGQYLLTELFPEHRYRFDQRRDGFLIHRSSQPWVSRDGRKSDLVRGAYALLEDGRVIPFFYYSQSNLTHGNAPDRILGQVITRYPTTGHPPLGVLSDQEEWLRLLQTQVLRQHRYDGLALPLTNLPSHLRRDLGNPIFYSITQGDMLP